MEAEQSLSNAEQLSARATKDLEKFKAKVKELSVNLMDASAELDRRRALPGREKAAATRELPGRAEAAAECETYLSQWTYA